MQISWLRGHATHIQRHQIHLKPSKSGLIGVWHKDNLYLGINTIGRVKVIIIKAAEILAYMSLNSLKN
jgi:hypothetical protein